MKGLLYLIGGGELRNGDTKLIDEDILALSPTGSVFVFFGFAAGDSTDYAAAVTSVYGDKYSVVVSTVAKGRDFAVSAMESASVIYLGGGSTDELLRVFKEWDLTVHLVEAFKRGAHIAGISAGAYALSTYYIDTDNETADICSGWGLAPVGILAHATKESFNSVSSLWKRSQAAHQYPFIAIGEGAAWRIGPTAAEVCGNGPIWHVYAALQ